VNAWPGGGQVPVTLMTAMVSHVVMAVTLSGGDSVGTLKYLQVGTARPTRRRVVPLTRVSHRSLRG
jgi:hypothetical protein